MNQSYLVQFVAARGPHPVTHLRLVHNCTNFTHACGRLERLPEFEGYQLQNFVNLTL